MIDASDEPPPATAIEVRIAPGVGHAPNVDWIAAHLALAANLVSERESIRIARLAALIVDDARMLDLHSRHSNDATTTDVLTFDLRDDPALPIDADIVVCVDEADRRAAEFGHSVDRELLLYCVHGLLHCAGHDDHDAADWRRMHAREDEILRAIGIGATFDPNPSGRDETGGGDR